MCVDVDDGVALEQGRREVGAHGGCRPCRWCWVAGSGVLCQAKAGAVPIVPAAVKLSISAGVQPMLVAGGVDSPITEGIVKGYTMLRALTQSWNDQPERASRPFSANRNGFVLAEGSWMFVLEE